MDAGSGAHWAARKEMEMSLEMDLLKLAPALAVAAGNCRYLAKRPNGKEEYWVADVKVVRHGLLCNSGYAMHFVHGPIVTPVSELDGCLKAELHG